jgi:hypothetical protein
VIGLVDCAAGLAGDRGLRRLVKKSLQGLELLRVARDLTLTDCQAVGGIVAAKIEPESSTGRPAPGSSPSCPG